MSVDVLHMSECPIPSGREEEEDDQVFVGSTRSVEYFDELGKKTLENEDACHTLTKELKDELAKSPNNVPMLWRLSRALVHLSMHSDQQGRVEEEKQLLLEGERKGLKGCVAVMMFLFIQYSC